jgi:hypothetical protein
LGKENRRTNGAVEAYIYGKFDNKHEQLSNALAYCLDATPSSFYVKKFIDSFWEEDKFNLESYKNGGTGKPAVPAGGIANQPK